MNTRLWTTGEVARRLGTTVPRVLRAAGSVAHVRHGNRTLFDNTAVVALTRHLGSAPVVRGRTRSEMFVLKALSVRPFGLASARQVAVAAGVAPATAAAALGRLAGDSLVVRDTSLVTRNGRVVRRPRWRIRWTSREWAALGPAVRTTVLTEAAGRPRSVGLAEVGHLLWTGRLVDYDKERDAVLIARRVLTSHDPRALGWLADEVPPGAIREAARGRGVDSRTADVAKALARSA